MVLTDRIKERDITGACPPMKTPKNLAVAKTGFPQPPVVVSEKKEPDMSDLNSSIHIRASDFAKLEWTNPVSEEEEQVSSSSDRYDFEGIKIESEESYSPELYHHGVDPGRPGYTLSELFHLSQSGFASQKSIAIVTIGKIAKNYSNKRELHRTLVGEWKAHIRFSVACSDTSTNVRNSAWDSLLSLIENIDSNCGCIVDDLATVFEFFRSFDQENDASVKVMAYIANVLVAADDDDLGEFKEAFVSLVQEACDKRGLDLNRFKCGLNETNIRDQLVDDSISPAEIFACICDRIACVSSEPLLEEDVEFLQSLLSKKVANFPFFSPGQVDEFAWTSRSSLVVQSLMEGAGGSAASFIAKLCFQFTSALFPLECRASIWCDLDVLDAIGRSCKSDVPRIFANHDLIDFACRDVADDISRESAPVVRAIRNGCSKYRRDEGVEKNEFILETAEKVAELVV